MLKNILLSIFAVFLMCSVPNIIDVAASTSSWVNLKKEADINWMYKNTQLKRKEKIRKEVIYKELKETYSLIMTKRFPEVKMSLARIESSFDQSARGKSGERCQFQINTPHWIDELRDAGIIQRPEDLTTSIKACIDAGSYIFDSLYDKYGSIERAVKAYNGGGDPNYVKKFYHAIGTLKVAHEEASEKYVILNGVPTKNIDVLQ